MPGSSRKLRERLKDELDGMVVHFMTLRREETDSGKREALGHWRRERKSSYLDLLTVQGLRSMRWISALRH